MTGNNRRGLDRRDFLRTAAIGSVVGGGYLTSGGVIDLLAAAHIPQPGATQGRPFEMLVLGDSIMWGQGLKEEQKFSYHVAEWIKARLPGIDVHRHVFAHSGARIEPDEVKDAKPPKHGEVPSHFPSITAQVDAATTAVFPMHPPLDPRSVSLILLDGGINDFGSKVIISPDPRYGRARVRSETQEKCIDRMGTLLPKVVKAFPNARIVVTNYFQIVSRKSDMVVLWDLLRFWDLIGNGVNKMTEDVRAKMSDQALEFHRVSTEGFREVVAKVAWQVADAGKGALPQGTAADNRFDRLQRRVALAEVPFGEDNAYGAPETFLFYLNEPDPAASVRKPICMEQVPNTSLELPNCLLAATGHPNTRGARAYARAIQGVIEQWVPDWQASFGVTTPKGPSGLGRETLTRPRPRATRP